MRPSSHRFADLCRELYALAQLEVPGEGWLRGRRWETLIADVLKGRGFPIRWVPGGVEIFGVLPASLLRHETDAAIDCTDALVMGEWKAFLGTVPKNEVLRFKAVADDVYDAMVRPPKRPLLRLFGVAGDARHDLRWYAARHGIALIERSRWPAPVLADLNLQWPSGDGPSEIDRSRLAFLFRSMQKAYPRLPDGSLKLTRSPNRPFIDSVLALQDYWSERLWETLDQRPGLFESYLARLAA